MKKQLIPLFFLAMVLYTKAIGKIGNNANPSLVTIDAICNASIQVELDASGIASIVAEDIDNGSTSDQGPVSLSIDISAFNCSNIGTPVTVTLTVEDGTGDSATCTSEVSVIDAQAPEFDCADLSIDVGDGATHAVIVNDIISNLDDNCAMIITTGFLSDFSGWIEETDAANVNLNKVEFVDANTGWIIGNTGSIQHTTNGGALWVNQNSGVTNDLLDLSFVNTTAGWVVGNNNTLLHTTDGGVNWTPQSSPAAATVILNAVDFIDSSNGWIVGSANTVLHTTDGGANWTQVNSTGGAFFKRSVFFLDINQGWITGNNGTVLSTMDAGVTWTDISVPSSEHIRGVQFVDANTGWVIGNNGTIFHTTNGGSTWTAQTSGTSNNLLDLHFYNNTSGYIVGAQGVVLHTADAGTNWSPIQPTPNPNSIFFRGVSALGEQEVTIIGGLGRVFSYFNGIIEENSLEFECEDLGETSLMIFAEDENDNRSTCTVTLSVEDLQAPMAMCQDVSVFLDASGIFILDPAAFNAESLDACSDLTLSINPTSVDCSLIGEQMVTLTVTDESSNMQTCTATVTLEDNLAPVIECQNVEVILDQNGVGNIAETDVLVSVLENCASYTTTFDQGTFSCADLTNSPIEITATVTDAHDNSSNCQVDITIIDNLAPELNCQTNYDVALDPITGLASILASDIIISSSDNCTNELDFVLSQDQFDCSLSEVTVILTATDESSNESTCNVVVSINDSTDPQLTCFDYTVYLPQEGFTNLTADSLATFSDNCSVVLATISSQLYDCDMLGDNAITVTVTDATGNTSSCLSHVTVVDQIAPVVTCNSAALQLDDQGEAILTEADIVSAVEENCGGYEVDFSQSLFTCSDLDLSPIAVLVTFTDNSLNASTCTVDITIQDQLDPVITCETSVEVSLDDIDGTGSISVNDVLLSASDNCSSTLSYSLTETEFDCLDDTVLVTLTASDESENATSCGVSVEVIDDTAPELTCQDYIVFLPASGFTILTTDSIATFTDNCSIVSTSMTIELFDCDLLGLNTVEVTAVDPSGNESICSSSVVVIDNLAPEANCQPLTVQLGANGTIVVDPALVDNGSFDNCDEIIFSLSPFTFDCSNVGVNPVQLTVTDISGNSAVCSTTIIVEDNMAPSANCFSAITLPLDSEGNLEVSVSDVDAGSEDNCAISSSVVSPSSFDCDTNSPVQVTLTLTDPSGQSASCQTLVSIIDDIAPEMTCIETLDVMLDPSGNGTLSSTDVVLSLTDNCGSTSVQLSTSTFDCTDVGAIIEVEVVGSDDTGNTSTCQVAIVVIDNIDPVLACQDITVDLDQNGSVIIEPADLVNNVFEACGLESISLDHTTFDCSHIGVQDVIVTVEDIHGNISACFQQVTIEDNEEPEVICQDISLNLGFGGSIEIELGDVFISASDNCSEPIVSIDQTIFACEDVGINELVVLGVDESGNEGSCIALVTVEDNIPPAVMCPNTITEEVDDFCSFEVPDYINLISTADNCTLAGEFVIEQSPSINSTIQGAGHYNLNFLVEDVNGNQTPCVTQLILEDNVDPVIVCNDLDIALEADGVMSLPLDAIGLGSFDNCSAVLEYELGQFNSFDCLDVGEFEVELSVSDESGNTSSCTATIILMDNTPPVVTCIDANAYLDENGEATLGINTVENILGEALDPCGVVSTVLSYTEVDCSHLGTQDIDLIVTDVNGNQTICTSQLTVLDTIAPALICRDFDVALGDDGTGILLPEDVIFQLSDACGIAVTLLSENTFDCSDIGIHTVQLSVFDNGGNEVTCLSEIEVEDQAAPVITCQNAQVVLDDTGTYLLELDEVLVEAIDLCGEVTFSYGPNIFACTDAGVNIINVMATDEAGNTSTCSPLVFVSDLIEPQAICTDLNVELDENGMANLLPADFAGLSSDNCASIQVVPPQINVDCSQLGLNSYQINVFDPAGNSDQCMLSIQVVDLLGPELNLLDTFVLTLDANGLGSVNVNEVDVSSQDNCGSFEMGFDETIQIQTLNFDCDDEGFHVIGVYAVDESGNTAFTTVVIEVVKSGGCEPTIDEVIIAGEIYRSDNLNSPVPNTEVNLSNGVSQNSDLNGAYSFAVLADSNYVITPYRNDELLNGVTTLDLVTIQSWILGLSNFDSPYQMIAADANNSESITTLDIVVIQKAILGLETEFLNNTSWRFVDAAYNFPDPNDPWANGGFPETIALNAVASDTLGLDFVGIKIGDMNYTAIPLQDDSDIVTRNSSTHTLKIKDESIEVGNSVKVSIEADLEGFKGAQFALKLDPDQVQFIDLNSALISDQHYRYDPVHGVLYFSILSNGYEDSNSLLELELEVKKSCLLSEAIQLQAMNMTTEWITDLSNVQSISLEFIPADINSDALLQVSPNPFYDQVYFNLDLNKAAHVRLNIRNQLGQLIYEEKGAYAAGLLQLPVHVKHQSGILFYELFIDGESTSSGKLIKL